MLPSSFSTSSSSATLLAKHPNNGNGSTTPTSPTPPSSQEVSVILQALQRLEQRVDDMDVQWCQRRDQTFDAIEAIRQRLDAITAPLLNDV